MWITRLFSIVDVWDALCIDRPYRKKLPPGEVIQYLQDNSGLLFGPRLVELFISIMESGQKRDGA